MKKMAELVGQELKWVQPSALKMNYELRAGEETAATLRFRSSLGSLATAESADGCWSFKRVGFFQTHVTIRQCGSEEDIAVFRNNTWRGGGTLEFPNGSKIPATTNFWQTKLEFQNEVGDPLIRFQQGGLLHLSATVEVLPEAVRLADLPVLGILGWYLIVMMNMDAAAITATTSSV
jgi:hypothetical protein